MASPKCLIAVGKIARDHLEVGIKGSSKVPESIPRFEIVHPAALLRQTSIAREHGKSRSVIAIRDALEAVFDGKEEFPG